MLPTKPELLFLAGGGEMGARIRDKNWSRSPLGAANGWAQSLKTALQLILNSRYPMFVWWGPELLNFYNDAYIPVLGKRHPASLGQPAHQVWADIWATVGPEAYIVVTDRRATWNEERLLVMERHGFAEETYFTWSYSPLAGDSGEVGGVFCACTEDTQRVLGRRRMRTLRELSARAGNAKSAEDACHAIAQILAGNPQDIPFALIYLREAEAHSARLAGLVGLAVDSPAAPAHLDWSSPDGRSAWLGPLKSVLEHRRPEIVQEPDQRLGPLPGGIWPEPARTTIVLPITDPSQDGLAGFLIVGVSPYRPLDDDYTGFFDLLAAQVSTSVASARAYDRERRRAEMLAELDRAKTTFFSNISHEFRTPLALMLGPVEDVLAEIADVKHRNLLGTAHRNALRLQKLVNMLLEFSRIEAGRMNASYEPTDLAALTIDLASNFRSVCEKAGLDLRVRCPPLPEPVYVDPEMWEKIILNLISNAFKFTLEGYIEISLQSCGDHVQLAVQDSGIGIAARDQARLFERFYRVEQAHGRSVEGSGIGLALLRELVRLHGGDIEVQSELDRGSTFFVRVPFGYAHLPADQVRAARALSSTATGAAPFVEEALRSLPDPRAGNPPAGLTAPAARLRPRIVLADDNADMRAYVQSLLSDLYDVSAFADGAAALADVRRSPPDLVITDVMMPRLDGFGLLRSLRNDPSTAELPVIMLSARAGEEAKVDGLSAGADDYVIKPFASKELLARVSAHMTASHTRNELLQRERRLRADLRLLWEAAAILLTTEEPDAMMQRLFGKIALRLDMDVYFNFMVNETGDALHLASCIGISEEAKRSIARLEFGQELCGTVARTKQTIVATHIQRSDDPMVQIIKSFDIRACICNPLIADNRLIGTLSFASRRRDDFDDEELELIKTICSYVTVAYERIRLVKELHEGDRRKNEFLATLAHELRNPLAPLRTGMQIIRLRSNHPELVQRTLDTMERQMLQMIRLIDDLLDISRITQGKVQLRNELCTLQSVLDSALESSQPLLEGAGIRLTTCIPEKPITLHADKVRLAQVFSNLLNNAAKYTERGGQAWLTVERLANEAVVRLKDTGIGIPADMLSKVFDMFTQVDRSLERSHGGLGIGLSLVRVLVELHGGTVVVHSDGVGKGSEFTVRLLLAAGANPVLPRVPAGTESPSTGCRVLVVDDNIAAAGLLAMMLEMSGHEVRTAHDGQAAVQAAEAFRPDLVILDIGLPVLDGYDVARRIRAQPWGREMGLAALTGWGQPEDRARTTEAGFDRHYVKPIETEALYEIVDFAAKKHRTRRNS